MNHCGRPVCKCYGGCGCRQCFEEREKNCCEECYGADMGGEPEFDCIDRDCPCHVKPVQRCKELIEFSSGAKRKCENPLPCVAHKEKPVQEDWRVELGRLYDRNGMRDPRTALETAILIETLLKAEKEASVEFIAVHKDDWMAEGAKAERSRLLEAVGKLRKGEPRNSYTGGFDDALDEVLKILSGEGV